MEEDTLLYMQLLKLSAIKSEEDIENLLATLWRTRKTGLTDPEKSYVQSLLNLHSLGEVDPVLACLRLLIRKFVYENFTGDDLLKMFPADLSLDLQSILIMLFQKHQKQWKEEISRDQQSLQRTSFSHQVNGGLPPSFASFPSSEISATLWPRHDDPVAHFNRNNLGASTPIISETTLPRLAPIPLQCDVGPPDNLGILPRLKSMTWTLENRNTSPTNRVAVISLKLQDYTKSPLGEMEVKFQLTRDTLEAMLRSMAYISEQLSNFVGSSSGPLQKKQRQ
ncbi:hypothetical protein F0562_016207 [Nyssa sinensis]|uniref:COMM domain-containing protein n=1 Tax=Nyssa sinensis TaxID=561372 RepID=A0A5J4ZM48_9ASTE|nr:hypothetical protein F0562_016207 [Nyssa sinensis]